LTITANNNLERTEVLYGSENVMYTLSQFVSRSKTINSCGDSRGPSFVIEIREYHKLLTELKKRKIKIRFITDITKDNLVYCKELMNYYAEIRHLEGIKANFSISESEYIASSTLIQGEKVHQSSGPIQQVIYSNVKDIVDQQQYVFESFWNKSILAEQRFNEIEKGYILGHTEVIQIPIKTKELFIKLVKKSKEEILLLLPSVNAFLREERIGIIHYLKEAAEKRGINVMIMTPTNDIINEIIQNIKSNNINNLIIQPFEISSAEINVNTVTILVVDRKESLVIEKKDDSKMDILDAIGLATYSTSRPTVVSYINIFESLSKQVNLYNQLKVHGKMQEEFINIASHELRTPTQAILAYSDLLQHHPEKRDEMIQAIKRNATRLQRLTEDILDVTKIESNALHLHKEIFDLTDLLSITIDDYKNKIEKNDNGEGKIRLIYTNINKEPLFVEADYQRIVQVLSNILNNAVKFAKEGKVGGEEGGGGGHVYITAEKKKTGDGQQVTVRIKDTGQGIDNDMISRLFTKFATKSTNGTGLGLFICKSLIESHGGTIWAENNKDGKGATFAFSLPIMKGNNKW
jgi:two-component system, OmpR family, sensor histidine kinase VicK